MNHPLIRIQSSHLLFNSVSEETRQGWADMLGHSLMSFEEVEAYVAELKTVWSEYEQPILDGLASLYGVEFRKPIIDVYVTPWSRCISAPLILKPSRPPRVMVEVLIHELLHGLLTDNSSYSMYDPGQEGLMLERWAEMFGDHARLTLVHIPVHAGLKAILIDVLGEPERLERDIARCRKSPAYKAAWEYVEKGDYREINQRLAELYSALGDKG